MPLIQNKPQTEKLWVYTVLPPLILNIGSFFTYGAYYALFYTRPEQVAGITRGSVRAATDILIFVVEWAFSIAIILRYRQSGRSLRQLIAPEGNPRCFHWGPTLLLFVGWNLLFALYMLVMRRLYPTVTDVYQGLPLWVRLVQWTLIPVTAGFCEELIWRAYIPTRMVLHGYRFWPVVLLSSLSFATIHGVFLPDKLLVTFLLGVLAAVYYLKERNLVPIIFTHWFVDVWSFGLFMFG